MTLRLLLAVLLLSGCGDIPQDPDGTLDGVRERGSVRVGMIAADAPLAPERQEQFLSLVAAEARARPSIERGAAEPLLMKLEAGELDLVLGEFAPASPWGRKVTFLPPLKEQVGDGHTMLLAAAKNGENEWIGILHRAATKTAAAR